MRLQGDGILLRIYINETDRYKGEPLAQAIVEALRKSGIAGATVIHGAMGYGAHSLIQTLHLLDISKDRPVIIETIDTTDKIDQIIPKLDEMIKEGLVITQRVYVR